MYKPVESECNICGCTDSHGCENGCYWVNEEETFCSNCAELEDIEGANSDLQHKLILGTTEDSKAQRAKANFHSQHASSPPNSIIRRHSC